MVVLVGRILVHHIQNIECGKGCVSNELMFIEAGGRGMVLGKQKSVVLRHLALSPAKIRARIRFNLVADDSQSSPK